MKRPKPSSPLPILSAILVSLTLLATASMVGHAQGGQEHVIADGEYVGSHGVSGLVLTSSPQGEIWWEGKVSGGLSFQAAVGALDGEWDLTGQGEIEASGFTSSWDTDVMGTIGGTVSRESAAGQEPHQSIEMTGTEHSVMQSASGVMTTRDAPVKLEVVDLKASCTQVVGTWLWVIEEEVQAAGQCRSWPDRFRRHG